MVDLKLSFRKYLKYATQKAANGNALRKNVPKCVPEAQIYPMNYYLNGFPAR